MQQIDENKGGLEPLMQEALALLRQIAANTGKETPVSFSFGSIPLGKATALAQEAYGRMTGGGGGLPK